MATLVTRYVNTASTAGGDGTTNDTAGATRAYVSMQAAITAEVAVRPNLVSNDEVLQILCCGSAADTTVVVLNGFTTDATRYVEIKGNAGHANGRHAGVWSTSKYRISVNNDFGYAIHVRDPFTRIEGILIEHSGAEGYACLRHDPEVAGNAGNDGSIYTALICRNALWTLNGHGVDQRAGDAIYRNVVCYNNAGFGFRCVFATAGLAVSTFDNCVAVQNGHSGASGDEGGGIQNSSASNICAARNTYSGGSIGAAVEDYHGSAITMTTSRSSDGTMSTTVVACSTSSGAYFTNLTVGTEDLHIGASSALKDAGTDLSGSFTTDIDGQTRPTGANTWDIGADEYIEAGGGPIKNPVAQLVRPFNMQRTGRM